MLVDHMVTILRTEWNCTPNWEPAYNKVIDLYFGAMSIFDFSNLKNQTMLKIQIKSIYGSVLFEYEKENNTLRDTVIKAVKSGAYLSGANLSGVKIKKAIVFTGLYAYVVIPIISEDGKQYVKMGCYLRTVEDWDNDFWNNNSEFPNDGSVKSNLRLFAYETAKKWIEINLKN